MSIKQLFTNNAVSLLASPIGPSDTTITVVAGHGALFPTPQENEFFTVTLEDERATIQEILHVTQRVGDTFTVTRAQEGTKARSWSASSGNDTLVDHRLTAETLDRLSNKYTNQNFPVITTFGEALDYLLSGSPVSGGQEIDATVTTTVAGNETIINTPSAYKPGTTTVFVGGLRQKRGVDFIEAGSTELRLQFVLSQADIDEGQNVVVDYVVA